MRTGKKHFNVIDYLILILLAASLASAVYFFVHRNGVFTKYKYDVEYKIQIDGIDAEFSENIAVGDAVCDKYTSFVIGTVTDVSVDAHYMDSYGVRDTVRMTVTVEARAEEHDGQLSVNGVTIAKGQNIYFRVPGLEYLGQCVDVKIAG